MALYQTLSKTVLVSALSLGLGVPALAADSPNDFVKKIAEQTLEAFKQDSAAKQGDTTAINKIIDQHLMPHVNFEKTTRLAVGQPWRQASSKQKEDLVEAFKGTLVRTYSGAFKNIKSNTKIEMQNFRGNADANDVVVRSRIVGASGGPVSVDYRLEKSQNSWKVYDFNVEGIWLIQNYRNQFSGEIQKNGIDGLIDALKKKK